MWSRHVATATSLEPFRLRSDEPTVQGFDHCGPGHGQHGGRYANRCCPSRFFDIPHVCIQVLFLVCLRVHKDCRDCFSMVDAGHYQAHPSSKQGCATLESGHFFGVTSPPLESHLPSQLLNTTVTAVSPNLCSRPEPPAIPGGYRKGMPLALVWGYTAYVSPGKVPWQISTLLGVTCACCAVTCAICLRPTWEVCSEAASLARQ